ncbi:MAG: TIGR03905 family TSCPD domain-containing protein [Clostridia bacterium]|nr:TIGR03905 family TSCPD domain-containing protein [Clostridia bacterium]
MHYDYVTHGTCAKLISLDIENGIVSNVKFMGGCDGNLKAIPKLVEGLSADVVAEKLSGIRCGMKDTSCGDQLAKAVLAAKAEEAKA